MGIWILLAVLAPVPAVSWGRRRLLMLRDRAQNAWLPIEARLEQRHERIRTLLAAVAASAGSESAVSGDASLPLREALSAPGIPARAEAENELTRALCRLLNEGDEASSWRAQPHLRGLGQELAKVEEEIARAAEYYNQQVMAWNKKIHELPWRLMADLFCFRPLEYFVFDDPDPRAEQPVIP